MVSRTDTTRSLKDIDIPTLIIAAQDDAIISPVAMKSMAKDIINSRYVELKDSGHVSMLENPNDFLIAIEEFLHTL